MGKGHGCNHEHVHILGTLKYLAVNLLPKIFDLFVLPNPVPRNESRNKNNIDIL